MDLGRKKPIKGMATLLEEPRTTDAPLTLIMLFKEAMINFQY
jgi:hypothetical protein